MRRRCRCCRRSAAANGSSAPRSSKPKPSAHCYSQMALLQALRQASGLQAAGRLAPALQQLRGFAAPANQMALIKELRERTGSPIGDVKKCLESCGWDLGEAAGYASSACAMRQLCWHGCLLPPPLPPLPPPPACCLPLPASACVTSMHALNCRGGNCGAAQAGPCSGQQKGVAACWRGPSGGGAGRRCSGGRRGEAPVLLLLIC